MTAQRGRELTQNIHPDDIDPLIADLHTHGERHGLAHSEQEAFIAYVLALFRVRYPRPPEATHRRLVRFHRGRRP